MSQNIRLYIGIDVSKGKNAICIKSNEGNELKRFQISNTKADLDKLRATVAKFKTGYSEDDDVVFGMEATGIYYLPLYLALKRDGCRIRLYNPIQTHGYRKMEIRKTKTDQIDASIIADMLRYSEPPLANGIQNLNLYRLRELIRVRQRLVEKRSRCKIQVIRNLDMVWPGYKNIMPMVFGKTSMAILKKCPVPSKITMMSFGQFYDFVEQVSRSQITQSKAQEIYEHADKILSVPELELASSIEIKMLISQIEMSNKQIQAIEMKINKIMKLVDSKITTIPGISDILGAVILGEIADIERFSSVKKLVAFAGLDPVVSQSGQKENTTGPISKRGPPLLRHALFMAANAARQNDENPYCPKMRYLI